MAELTDLLGHSLAETVAVLDKVNDPITAYAYISTPAPTAMATAGEWYFFNSTFTNMLSSNVSGDTNGIEIDKDGRIEIEWVSNGSSDKAAVISVGIVKNGTFVTGELTAGSVLDGSVGSYEAGVAASSDRSGSPLSLWAGDVVGTDIISLVISSSVNLTTFTPTSGATSLQQLT